MNVSELPRRYTLGGSDVAAAVGIDPHRSPVMLWAEKTGRYVRPDTEAMEWGTRLEPLIWQVLDERGFELVPAPAGGFQDTERKWLVGHPDGFTVLADQAAVLEVKTAGAWAHRAEWNGGGVPVHYQAQAQTYMHLTGRERALVACLVAGQRLELHELDRDQSAIDTMLVLLDDFAMHLRSDRPPTPDGSESSRAAVIALFPEHEPGKVHRLTGAEWSDVRELRARREQLDAVKEQVAELENRLKLAMGDAETAVSPHDTDALHWRTFRSTRIDTTRLKAEEPELAERFATTTTTRRFTLA